MASIWIWSGAGSLVVEGYVKFLSDDLGIELGLTVVWLREGTARPTLSNR